MATDIKGLKQSIRERIWRLLEERGIAKFPRPVYGRIPIFVGAGEAAQRLFRTSAWRKARVIKVNPDSPQKPARYRALAEGKTVIMATPRLRQGFLLLNPRSIPVHRYAYASTIKGAFRYGKLLSLREIPRVDLVVTGCVAVDKWGGRLGKGGGYAELEYAILREIGSIDENVYVATTVHDLQVLDEKIPREPHDLTVDLVFTPTRSIHIEPRPPKPRGILWDLLGEKAELPVFKELKNMMEEEKGSR